MAIIKNESPFIGTELKLNIHIEPIGETTMDDYDFEVEMYCSPKQPIVVQKSEAIRVDSDNYVVLVDTNGVGVGNLKCKVTAQVPDGDFPDLLRTEVVCIDTGINIIKAI